ncbi:MAG TPA: hypothetical protein DCQ06_00480, partial [Myxococcales bacterium]|nr:hypothetical protein [Myxococcales bacterium]
MNAHVIAPPAAQLALDGRVARVVVTATLTTAVLVHGSGAQSLQFALLAFGMMVTGLPHGAVDHRVGVGALGLRPLKFYVAYLAIMATYAGLWFIWPSAGLVGFLVTSAWHFGEGDVRGWRELRGWRVAFVAWTRGILVVGGLLYADSKISGAHLFALGASDFLFEGSRAIVLWCGVFAGFAAWWSTGSRL